MKRAKKLLSLLEARNNEIRDLSIERDRYDTKAILELHEIELGKASWESLDGISEIHHEPYLRYYQSIINNIPSNSKILELASGTGRHSLKLLDTGGEVWALDISATSLEVLRLRSQGRINTVCAEIGKTPFENETFDFVVCCGGLSYENNQILLEEVVRILKPGGGVIFLDTLNHNPIYRINRFIHFLKGNRTFSTLKQMPRMNYINFLSSHFERTDFQTFGNLLWLSSILHRLGIRRLDLVRMNPDSIHKSKWGFKFLLTGHKLIK